MHERQKSYAVSTSYCYILLRPHHCWVDSMTGICTVPEPQTPCRYSGYCAWRGVVTDSEAPKAAAAVRRAFPDMGTAIYFEIAERTHGVLYELPRQRLNWLW